MSAARSLQRSTFVRSDARAPRLLQRLSGGFDLLGFELGLGFLQDVLDTNLLYPREGLFLLERCPDAFLLVARHELLRVSVELQVLGLTSGVARLTRLQLLLGMLELPCGLLLFAGYGAQLPVGIGEQRSELGLFAGSALQLRLQRGLCGARCL